MMNRCAFVRRSTVNAWLSLGDSTQDFAGMAFDIL